MDTLINNENNRQSQPYSLLSAKFKNLIKIFVTLNATDTFHAVVVLNPNTVYFLIVDMIITTKLPSIKFACCLYTPWTPTAGMSHSPNSS